MANSLFKIIECPRDAMQGIKDFIPTNTKAEYINSLLDVGFDTIDFGSFVSPKAVPQMSDTAKVLELLDLDNTPTRLLAIIANERGAQDAAQYDQISYLGYPLSISETFQQRNANKSIIESLNDLDKIQSICLTKGKTLVVYLSMGFGNPYGDPYDPAIVSQFTGILESMGVTIVSIADTLGIAEPLNIETTLKEVVSSFPDLEVGAHLHSRPERVFLATAAAYNAGVRRIDGALLGFGGCPMADDELIGNLATENIITYLENSNETLDIDKKALEKSRSLASNIFL